MRTLIVRPAFAASAIVAAAGLLAAGLALRPAIAGTAGVNPFALVKCTSSSPCETYKNTGTGAGLQGISTKNTGLGGVGVAGTAGTYGAGVAGSAGTSGNGVSGSGGNTGVSGNGGQWGVFGYSNISSGMGVEGQSVNGDGVVGFSSCCNGMSTASSSGYGLYALSENSHAAIYALAGQGDAISANANWGSGAVALRGNNPGDNGSDGNGADVAGSYIGVIARNYAGQGYPFLAADTNGTDLVYADSAGNLYVHGSYLNFAKTRNGHEMASFTSQSASPTIEDNGTAQLVGGMATVQLDPSFAQSIDLHRAYQVMLTPDGDTKGLYIASKTTTSFVVRETQGGRSTIAFDYHIYAPTLGHANQRMSEMMPGALPHAPYIVQSVPAKPKFFLKHQ